MWGQLDLGDNYVIVFFRFYDAVQLIYDKCKHM